MTRGLIKEGEAAFDLNFALRLREAVVDDINGVRKEMGLASLEQAVADKIADREAGIVIPDIYVSPEEMMNVTRNLVRGNGWH